MRPPRWAEEATDADDADVRSLLDGDPELAELASGATEPLDDEVAALVRRAAPAPRRRIAWVALPVLALAILLWTLLPGAGATFRAEGTGAWSVVEDAGGTTVVVQESGVVVWDVDPRAPGERFVVRAGALEVEVIGTVFEVGLDGERAWVEVRRGVVRVRDAGVETTVPAGARWERAPRVVAREAPREQSPEIAREVAPEPIRAEPPAAARAPRPAPPPAAPPVPAPSLAARFAALLDRRDAGEPAAELAAAFRAFATEAAGTPLGAQAEAEALALEAVVLPPEDALAAIDAWLASHPESPRRLGLLEARVYVARERLHDCAIALPTLRALARVAAGERRARAEAWRGLCASDPGERVAALREALRLGVAPPLRDEVELALEEAP